jgi:glutaredoxin-related protein
MVKVYGSEMCPDCRACQASFDAAGIAYQFIDINASLRDLKAFLALRDHLPVFDHLKAIGDIGIPAVVLDDGTVLTDWEGWLKGQGKEVLSEASGEACSLDGKHC